MGHQTPQSSRGGIWALAERQHGVVARRQLLELGFRPEAIKHRLANGRLYPVRRGVYALGRPQLTPRGLWMAAVLACGPDAALSHRSAAALWEIFPRAAGGIEAQGEGEIEVSVPAHVDRRRPGIVVHRRASLGPTDLTRLHGIPVTTPVCTLIDIATQVRRNSLEAVVNEADKRGLVDPETLRSALGELAHRPGVAALRGTLDRRTFTFTESELERRFLPIVRRAGLPQPQTRRYVNGFRVDFYWPDLELVVETDGLRYHRTPSQQARDRLRDQTHTAAGITCLRFTRAQVRFEPGHVQATLRAVARRLRAARGRAGAG